MKKISFLLATLLVSISSFALSDMVSVDFPAGSRTVPIEDLKDMYYSNTKDSLFLVLEDTTYAFKADSSLHVAFLDPIEGQHKREREALIAIYKALDGDNWYINDNWCSDKPLSEWYGIRLGVDGYIEDLSLECNNLSGALPKDIVNLKNLVVLNFAENNDITIIPNEVTKMQRIAVLRLPAVEYLPDSIFSITTLGELQLDLTKIENIVIDVSKLQYLINLSLVSDGLSFPINIKELKNLRALSLDGFVGKFPVITGLMELNSLSIVRCEIQDEFPENWEGLNNLIDINLSGNKIASGIPSNMLLLPKLQSMNLRNNHLLGSLPKEFNHYLSNGISDFGYIYLDFNQLSGNIQDNIQHHPNWGLHWQTTALNNQFNLKDIYLPGPQFKGIDIDGDSIYSEDVYPKNKYTILWSIASNMAWGTGINWNATVMTQFYDKYKNYGIDILYAADEWNTIEEIEALREEFNIQFRCFNTNGSAENRLIINQNKQCKFLQYYLTPEEILGNSVMVVDSTGNTVFMSEIDGYESELDQFLYRNLCKDSIDYYVSSDYSQHMLIDTLQMATIGKGIDIVLMGDAYSDRQIADSTYHKDLQYLYENLFTEEPYKSHKEMFNVFTVNVVSPTEGYEHGSTALGGFFGYETEVGGNDGAVIEYASLAVEYEKLDNAIVIVAMNSDKYAGTCYMYYPSDTTITFGSGLSISYFPKGGDAEIFAQLLHHEALGHGFAKLADEYAYEEFGAVPESTVALHQEQQSNWGWWKNIDFTNDSASIRWSRLLMDDRYQYDGLGAFEGGLTYWTGVWRPTENSIMRYNFGGFNAPSREAIYYRIHKLAYGEEWEYDYEKFVEWDAKNRKKADSPLLMPSREAIRNFVPTHPPVIKQMNWREALEDKQAPKQIQSREKVTPSNDQSQGTVKYVITTKK